MKHLVIFLLLGLLFIPVWGQSQGNYTLQQFLTTAIENNADIKKAGLRQTESQSKTKETIAQGLPQIDGKIGYSIMGIPEISLSSDLTSSLSQELVPLLLQLQEIHNLYFISSGVTVTQLVYSQAYLTGIKQSKKATELYTILSQKTEEEVIYNVASTYYQILSNYASLKILTENIENLEKLNAILTIQYENDFVKKTDVGRIQVQISNLKTKQEMLANAINIRERILNIFCGIPVDSMITVSPSSVDDIRLEEPATIPLLIDQLPSYRAMEKQQELSQLKIKSEEAAYYPNLAIYGRFNFNNYNTKFEISDLSNSNTFGFQANIPIFSSGMRRNKVVQSKLQLQEINEDVAHNVQLLGTQYQNAVNSLFSAWKGLQNQKQNQALAREVYGQVKLSYDEGMASVTDLLNVDIALLDAENLYQQQLLNYLIAGLDLKKSTGSLTSILQSK